MDLGFLRSLYESQPDQGSTGYVSVYLDTSRQTANPDPAVARRCRSRRQAPGSGRSRPPPRNPAARARPGKHA